MADNPVIMDIVIRPESAGDAAAIYGVTERAFADMPYSDGNEQQLVDRMRESGVLSISLVAEIDGNIVGHIAFTPAFPANGSDGWYALGPVSVEPELQKQGIGTRLIEKGIELLRERGAAGCILVGSPDYYERFGFERFPELAPDGQPAEYFMILPLGTLKPEMTVEFHPVFTE